MNRQGAPHIMFNHMIASLMFWLKLLPYIKVENLMNKALNSKTSNTI